MADGPEVSIVMPVYNGEWFIAESIGSVISQGFENWELIVSDDGSTDATRDIVGDFVSRDPRVRIITGDGNTGPGAARNRALTVATGRWIAYLDSDDLWLPDKLARTLDFAKTRASALTYTSYSRALAPDWRIGREISAPSSASYRQLLRSNVINTSTVVLDTELLPGFRWSEHDRPEDYVAWLDILRSGHVAYGLQESLTIYRKGHKSGSANKLKSSLRVLRIFITRERLSPLEVAWYFSNYTLRGALKHFRR